MPEKGSAAADGPPSSYAGTVSTTPTETSSQPPARSLTHDPDARRYTLRIDGALAAAVDYSENETSVSFTHTFTAPAFRGRGLAAEVVEFAVDDVEASGERRIIPMCWYAAEWFDKHPERAGLLTRGR